MCRSDGSPLCRSAGRRTGEPRAAPRRAVRRRRRRPWWRTRLNHLRRGSAALAVRWSSVVSPSGQRPTTAAPAAASLSRRAGPRQRTPLSAADARGAALALPRSRRHAATGSVGRVCDGGSGHAADAKTAITRRRVADGRIVLIPSTPRRGTQNEWLRGVGADFSVGARAITIVAGVAEATGSRRRRARRTPTMTARPSLSTFAGTVPKP